jgi:hypothetical protein
MEVVLPKALAFPLGPAHHCLDRGRVSRTGIASPWKSTSTSKSLIMPSITRSESRGRQTEVPLRCCTGAGGRTAERRMGPV